MSPIKKRGAKERAKGVQLLLLDVDGVLTDGRILMDDRGVESRIFDEKDGHGLKMLMRAGIQVMLLSGRGSEATRLRAKELGISRVYQNVHDKAEVFEQILAENGLEDHHVGYMGDDLVDLPVLKRAGFSAIVADAVEDLEPYADYRAAKRGGRGAVREVVEFILKAQDRWEEATARYRQ